MTLHLATHTDYFPNPTSYLVGLPAHQVTYNSVNTVVAEALSLYNGASTYTTQPATGILTATRTWTSGTNYSQVSYGYDFWGNRTTVTTYTGYGTGSTAPTTGAATTTTLFDSSYHTYPVSTTNALSQTTNWTYDYALGVPLTESDPNDPDPNSTTETGNTTISAQYDALGRMLKLIRPGDDSTYPTIAISYLDTFPFTTTITQKIDNTPRFYTIQRLYDGMGRQTQINSGGTIVDTFYDSATVTGKVCHIKSHRRNNIPLRLSIQPRIPLR